MASFQGIKNLDPADKEKRFWSKVDKRGPDECWIYKEGKNELGYGRFDCGYAYRYAWKAYNKCKIPKGRLILHHCDSPACCNPKHLYCGTQRDNMNDMVKRNRSNINVAFSHAKFHDKEILLIREMLKLSIYSQKKIAKMFKVNQSTISDINRSNKYPCKEGLYV